MKRRAWTWIIVSLAVALPVGPASAQLEDNLSAYLGANAEGYLKPLQEAFGQALNSNFFTTAAIPAHGLHLRVDVKAMSVLFNDTDDTFRATTAGGFSPAQTVDASTVVGPTDAVTVSGDGGTQYVFPGGFDLSSFTVAVPQLTVGTGAGTEAVLRYFSINTGDSEIGDVSFVGIGLRHSVSQYLPLPPVDLAASIVYQNLSVGEDLLDATAWSFGVQGSRGLGMITPYAGLSYDRMSMQAKYTATVGAESQPVDLDLESAGSLHATLGLEWSLGPIHINLAGDLAQRSGVSAGVGVGL